MGSNFTALYCDCLVSRDHVALTYICKYVLMDDFKGTDDGTVGDVR